MNNTIQADDTLKLLLFLQKYPNVWHGFATDKKTLEALKNCQKYYNIEVNEFNQMKLNTK